jgi:desulfoferrodoxin (superoxide reductase-like protein)
MLNLDHIRYERSKQGYDHTIPDTLPRKKIHEINREEYTMLRERVIVPGIVILLCLISAPAFANKASAAIDAPEKAKIGAVIKIKVTISHRGDNFIHHVDWAYVKVNGKEIGRWEFSFYNLPESENFSREVSYTVDGPLTIVAEGDCNIHGSEGKAEKKVAVE